MAKLESKPLNRRKCLRNAHELCCPCHGFGMVRQEKPRLKQQGVLPDALAVLCRELGLDTQGMLHARSERHQERD